MAKLKQLIKNLLLLFFIIFAYGVYAQKYDQNWLLGYGNDSLNILHNNYLDFSKLPIKAISRKGILKFGLSFNASISDNDGNFLFYSDGCRIIDSQNNLIENGDSINAGAVANSFYQTGYPISQGGIVLPTPGKINEFDFLSSLIESTLQYGGQTVSILRHHIKNSLNNKLIVTSKNEVILKDTLTDSNLMACKHANGEDWWIIAPRVQSNKYYRILFNQNGFDIKGIQEIGTVYNYLSDWSGQAVFTPDGNKYARYDRGNDLTIFNFDRCNGLLSNPIHITIHDSADTFSMGCGLACSPNSRFLYVSSGLNVYQLDMLADSIPSSMTTVAKFDGFYDPFPTNFYLAQLAPDNKIYMCSSNSTYSIHVIENPDIGGIACNVHQHAISLPYSVIGSMPFYPNYRLGPLIGVNCDSVNATYAINKYDQFLVSPNPSDEYININNLSNDIFESVLIYDITGKLRSTSNKKNNNSIITIDISSLQNGIYVMFINAGNGARIIKKFIKHASN